MLDAVIFDFDGVIVDTEPLHFRAFLRTLQPLGVEFDYARYQEQYIGFDDRDGFRAICAEHKIELDEPRLAGLIAQKAATFAHIVEEGVTPMPGAVELIEQVSQAMPVALCSGALRQDIGLILPRLGSDILEKFAVIVSADDVQRSKPDPQSYTLAAQRLGKNPRRCIAIEDTPAGIEAAQAAGIRTLAVASSFPMDRLVQADRVVPSLAQVNVNALRGWFA